VRGYLPNRLTKRICNVDLVDRALILRRLRTPVNHTGCSRPDLTHLSSRLEKELERTRMIT